MEEIEKKPGIRIGTVLLVALFGLAGFFIGNYHTERRMIREMELHIDTRDFPHPRHIEYLREQTGWEEPEAKIIDDLVSRPELIPHDPVLGGTMGFYDRDDIHILNDRWVIAAFEDGHVGGYMMLEYEITDDQELEWEIMDSYLE